MRVRLEGSRGGGWRGRLAHDRVVGASAAGAASVSALGPAMGLRLPAAYDLLDVPAVAGHRVLLQLERLGTPLGPVLAVQTAAGECSGQIGRPGQSGGRERGDRGHGLLGLGQRGHDFAGTRLRFFVEAGTTASFLADLKDLGWDPADTDIRTIGVVLAAETPLPPASSPRWVRPPETVLDTRPERIATLPPARLLLGALAYACRRAELRRNAYALFAGSRSGGQATADQRW